MPNLSLNLSLGKSNESSQGCHTRRRRWTRSLVEEDITVKDIDKVKLGRGTATLRSKGLAPDADKYLSFTLGTKKGMKGKILAPARTVDLECPSERIRDVLAHGFTLLVAEEKMLHEKRIPDPELPDKVSAKAKG